VHKLHVALISLSPPIHTVLGTLTNKTKTSTRMMNKQILFLLLSAPAFAEAQQSQPKDTFGRRVSKTLNFLSPLQSLTIFPKEVPTTSPRDEFVPKFKAGLEAEKNARQFLAKERGFDDDDDEYVGQGWEKKSEESEKKRAEKEDQFVERAYDRAMEGFKETSSPAQVSSKGSKFQFVGVVQPPNSEKKVKWFARKRPSNSKWNVRLLHVNRETIVRDLFVNGKVDVFSKYVNSGKPRDELKEGEDPSASRRPLIEADYNIKKRSVL